MNVICKRTCQIRINGKIHLIDRGQVVVLDELPKNGCFEQLEGSNYKIDFLTASEDELLKTKWKASEAIKVVNKEFDLDLQLESGVKKSEVVAMILDARYRAVS